MWPACSQVVLAGIGGQKKTIGGGRDVRRNMSDSMEVLVVGEAEAGVLL